MNKSSNAIQQSSGLKKILLIIKLCPTYRLNIIGDEHDINAAESKLSDAEEGIDDYFHGVGEGTQPDRAVGEHQAHCLCKVWGLVTLSLMVDVIRAV